MPVLEIDTLTAAITLGDLAHQGNDLVHLAQALDEDWKRYAPDPKTGSRHLISTTGNRTDAPPTGLPYYNTGLLQPGSLPAEQRKMQDRFLRGKPFMMGELKQTHQGYRFKTAQIKLNLRTNVIINWNERVTTFYLMFEELPETVMNAAIGRRLGDVLRTGHHEHLVIQNARIAEQKEMQKVFNQLMLPGLAIETELPDWQEVEFKEIYHKSFFG